MGYASTFSDSRLKSSLSIDTFGGLWTVELGVAVEAVHNPNRRAWYNRGYLYMYPRVTPPAPPTPALQC